MGLCGRAHTQKAVSDTLALEFQSVEIYTTGAWKQSWDPRKYRKCSQVLSQSSAHCPRLFESDFYLLTFGFLQFYRQQVEWHSGQLSCWQSTVIPKGHISSDL